MKTTRIFLTAALAAALILSGCSEKESDNSEPEVSASESSSAESAVSETSEVPKAEWTELTLEFPSGKDEMTDYNKDILSVSPFTANISLPSGWDVKYDCPPETKYLNLGVFSMRYIYDEKDNCVGAVGYNLIPPELSEEELMIPAAVYNQIALGNGYQFNVRNRYETVQSSDTCEAALTDVYYSDQFNDGSGEKTNKGIVMQDTSAGVYLAAEFENDALTDEQHKKIGESMKITTSEPEPEETEPKKTEAAQANTKMFLEIEPPSEYDPSENGSFIVGSEIDLWEALKITDVNPKVVGNSTCGYITVDENSEYKESENGDYTVTSWLGTVSVFMLDGIQTDLDMTAYTVCLTAAMNAEIDGFEKYDVNNFSVDGMDGYLAVMADDDTGLGFMMYAAVVDTDKNVLRCISCSVNEYTPENIIYASSVFDKYSRKTTND